MIIAIDFDGTCTTHEFPNIGRDIGAVPVLRRLVESGHQLILYTMRSDRETAGGVKDERIADVIGPFLTEAVNWFNENGILLYGIQSNPTQRSWTTSPKCYAHLYIDDAALGCPLTLDLDKSLRPFVNWEEVEIQLEKLGMFQTDNSEIIQP